MYYLNKMLVDTETRYLPLEKNGVSLGVHYEKAATLFSGPYSVGVNRAPLAVAFEEVRFHLKGS